MSRAVRAMSTAVARPASDRPAAGLRLISDGPAPGAWNMAMDEALLRAARRGSVALRLYGWSPGCLSLGRHQPAAGLYDRDLASRLGIDIVRRPTGGRAVFHQRELTYAVAAPADAWGGVRRSWRRINRALARALRRLGVDVEEAGRRPGATPGPSPRACFRDPLPGELVAGGRKIVGSAQWREGGALLQHGSLLLRDDQGMAERLRVGAPDGVGTASVGLVELLGAAPREEELRETLARGFAEELGLRLEPGEASAAELGEACRLEARYRSESWTWRR